MFSIKCPLARIFEYSPVQVSLIPRPMALIIVQYQSLSVSFSRSEVQGSDLDNLRMY